MNLITSLEKTLQSGEQFGSLFYEIFFDRYPDVKQYFDDTNMQRQSVVLTMSLKLVGEYHVNGYAAIKLYLQHVGTDHNNRGVPREAYPQFSDALLIALERFHGDDWNDALATEWRDAMDVACKAMFDGYDRHVGL